MPDATGGADDAGDDYMQRLLRGAPDGFVAGVDAAVDSLIHEQTARLSDASAEGSPIGDPEWANFSILYLVGLAASRRLEVALGRGPRRRVGLWAAIRSRLGGGSRAEPPAGPESIEDALPGLLRGAPDGFVAGVDAAVGALIVDQSARLVGASPPGSKLGNPTWADLAALYLVGHAAQDRLHRTEGKALRRMVHDALTPAERTAVLRMVAANPEREDAIYASLGEEIIRKGLQGRGRR